MRSFYRFSLAVAVAAASLTAGNAIAADVFTYDEAKNEFDEATKAKMAKYAEENPRVGGSISADWVYDLPEGVISRQVSYWSDDVRCTARLFFPKGFSKDKKYPAVVVGHGIMGIAAGIEKYGARFAERGLIAMVIDYKTFGYSDSTISALLEKDTTTDDKRVTVKPARIETKRTRFDNPGEVEDYRSAVSFLQGEPGVDPEKIGIWGSSNSGGVVLAAAGLDTRIKAVVVQVAGTAPTTAPLTPQVIRPQVLEEAIKRARTNKDGEFETGFSFKAMTDAEANFRNMNHQPARLVGQIPDSTAVLFLPAEKDELMGGAAGAQRAAAALKGGNDKCIVLPSVTHFQPYAGYPWEISSNLAADWFLKYLK